MNRVHNQHQSVQLFSLLVAYGMTASAVYHTRKKLICLENMSALQFAILMIPSSATSPFYFHFIRPQRMIIIICLNYTISLINIFHHLSLPSVIIIITIKCLNQTKRKKKTWNNERFACFQVASFSLIFPVCRTMMIHQCPNAKPESII